MSCKLPAMGQVQVADVVTTNSITRTWRDKGQIIYTENTTNDTFSHPQFIYVSPEPSSIKVANFLTVPENARITDFEILEATVYFCGYIRSVGFPRGLFLIFPSWSDPIYSGFIGYFCIPKMFFEGDSAHTLSFNPQDYSPYSGTRLGQESFCLDIPLNIEVIKVHDGIHIACVGKYRHETLGQSYAGSNNHFVADIVHSFADGRWSYYVSLDQGMEQFTDIAVTDNYVVTVAHKASNRCMFMHVLYRPTQAQRRTSILAASNTRTNMFERIGDEVPVYAYTYGYSDGFNTYHPRIVHTKGNHVAVASLTDSIGEEFGHFVGKFGASVKHFDVDALVNWSRGHFFSYNFPDDDPDNTFSIPRPSHGFNYQATPHCTADLAPLGPPDLNPNPYPIPVPRPDDCIACNTYSAMIDQSFNRGGSSMFLRYSIKDIKYDDLKNSVLIVQDTGYPPYYYNSNLSAIYTFDISSDTLPVTRSYRPDRHIYSIDLQTHDYDLFTSGTDDSLNDRKLEFGRRSSCIQADFIESVPLLRGVGFSGSLIAPWYVEVNAFSQQPFAVTLSGSEPDVICE